MLCESSYQQILNNIAELGIWASSFINISEAEDLSCTEFDFYREVYKDIYEKEHEAKQDTITKAFEYAGECTKAICKSLGGMFGSK